MSYRENVVMQNGWNDLKQYGISPLTGESCAYSMRLLCDLNEDGKYLLERFFGGTMEFRKGTNWNSQVNGKPAKYSVLLPYGILDDLRRFILFSLENKTYAYWYEGTGTMIGSDDDLPLEALDSSANRYVNYAKTSGQPSVADRNIHAISGRTV